MTAPAIPRPMMPSPTGAVKSCGSSGLVSVMYRLAIVEPASCELYNVELNLSLSNLGFESHRGRRRDASDRYALRGREPRGRHIPYQPRGVRLRRPAQA